MKIKWNSNYECVTFTTSFSQLIIRIIMKKIKKSDNIVKIIEIDDDDDPNQTIIIDKTYNVAQKKHHFDPLRTVPQPVPFKPPGQKIQFRPNPRYYKVIKLKKERNGIMRHETISRWEKLKKMSFPQQKKSKQ